jgi:hypothetical protein
MGWFNDERESRPLVADEVVEFDGFKFKDFRKIMNQFREIPRIFLNSTKET